MPKFQNLELEIIQTKMMVDDISCDAQVAFFILTWMA